MYLGVIFEETGAYQYKKNKEMERQGSGGGGGGGETTKKPGLEAGFEQDFEFGEDDPNGYWDKTILNEDGSIERAASTYR